MIRREEVLKEVSRLYEALYTDHFRKECIVDYIMRLVGQETAICECREMAQFVLASAGATVARGFVAGFGSLGDSSK